jgi:hypothetical protein
MTADVFAVHCAPPIQDEAIGLPETRGGTLSALPIRAGQFGPFQETKETVMGEFEKDRDNKPMSGQPGQGQQGQQDRNKPGSQNEPGRESNPREGQGSGSQQRPGSGSGSKSENDEESA